MATIIGTNASETLIGTAGNDSITGARGNDLAQMGDGSDVFIWLAGDGADTVEGSTGFDTLRLTASKSADGIALLADGTGATLSCNLESIGLDSIERVEMKALGGTDVITIGDLDGTGVTEVAIDLTADGKADTVSAAGSDNNDIVAIAFSGGKIVVADLPADLNIANAGRTDLLSFDGGEGNDIINTGSLAAGKISLDILGGAGNDVIFSGAGNDTVTGGDGDDVAYLGAGNDLFVSKSGEGADTIEGQDGTDTLRLIVRAPAPLITLPMTLVADDGRAKITGINQSLSVNDVERIEIQGGSGAGNDNEFKIGDLSGTDLKQVAIDLTDASSLDIVSCFTGAGNEVIGVSATGDMASITGLAAHLTIAGSESVDTLVIDVADGNDKIDASKLPQSLLAVSFDGGAGNDLLVGGQGNDSLVGAAGNDTVTGSGGADLIFLDGGDDLFQWKPGDGSDTVEGSAGTDTARVTGSKANDDFTIAPGGMFGSLLSSKALGMDLNLGTERLELLTLDGADTVTLENLGGSASFFEGIAIDLAATVGGKTADSKIDTVDLLYSDDAQDIVASSSGSKILVAGPLTEIVVDHAGKTDRLTIQTGTAADKIDAGAVAAGKIGLAIDGQDGDDTIVGSAGNDTVEGGDGNDHASLGLGNDLFVWSFGDGADTVEGGGGTDTLRLKGDSGNDFFIIERLGSRVGVYGDNGSESFTLDIDDIERLEFQAGGSGETIEIESLAGTDLKQVAIGLATDSANDAIAVNGTVGNDKVTVSLSGGTVSVTGLSAQVTVANVGANDRLGIALGGGNDVINAATLASGKLQLELFGESGNDRITGGAGNDGLFGDEGNDVMLGGTGDDSLFGGSGNDSLTGGAGNDMLFVGEGNDTITGGAGNDRIHGGLDADTLKGEAGNDTLNGGDGNDSLDGGVGDDDMNGGEDADTLKGSAGNDTLTGAEGNDSLDGGAGNDEMSGGLDADTLKGGTGNDQLLGDAGNDSLDGGAGNDELQGGLDADTLKGAAGNDILFGLEGNDSLDGGAGKDTILGGEGDDTINVSAGHAAMFYLTTLDGHDLVTGFDGNAAGGQDTFDLDLLFDNLGTQTADRAGRVSITDNGATVDIAVDADGDAGNGFELVVATLKTADVITVGQDIIVGILNPD